MLKNKFLSLVIAIAIILCIGCANSSGDDPKEPAKPVINQNIAGYWWYVELDTSTAQEETEEVALLVNNGSIQTANYNAPLSGTVKLFWDGKDKSKLIESTRTDCPEKAIGEGENKLGVYIYAPESIFELNIWAWDPKATSTNFNEGSWPGQAMETDAEIAVEKINVTFTFVVTGLLEGDVLFINGNAWNWDEWPFASWGNAEKAAIAVGKTNRFATADETGTATFGPYTIEMNKDVETSQEVKVVQVSGEDETSYEPGTINYSANGKYTVTPSGENPSYEVTIDVSEGSYNCSIN